jgi:hypothetical protein
VYKVAEDCLLPGLDENLLWRKAMLKLGEATAKSDPKQTFSIMIYPIRAKSLFFERRVYVLASHSS